MPKEPRLKSSGLRRRENVETNILTGISKNWNPFVLIATKGSIIQNPSLALMESVLLNFVQTSVREVITYYAMFTLDRSVILHCFRPAPS
jgi:hypothetical protein